MNNETIVDITQYGSADPSFVWRKGGATEGDNHFYLIRGTTNTVVDKDKNVYIEVDPDKKVVIFHNEAKLLNGVSFTDNSLNGSSLKDHSITAEKIAEPITLKGSIDYLTNGNYIDGVKFTGKDKIVHFDVCNALPEQQVKPIGCNGFVKENGSLITVHFQQGNTAEDVQLNVNDTGAAPIYYRNQKIDASLIVAHSTFTFVYFNGQYHTIDCIDNQVAQKYVSDGKQYNLLINPVSDHQKKTLTGSVGYIDTISINPKENVSVFKGSIFVDPIDKETNLKVATCGFVTDNTAKTLTDSKGYTDQQIVNVKKQSDAYTDAAIAPLEAKFVNADGDTMTGKLMIPDVDSQAGDNQVVSAKWTRALIDSKLGDVDLSSVLSLTGGIMTGPLHVVAPPLTASDDVAVSSKWVKDAIAAAKPPEVDLSSCVKKKGDTMEGVLNVVAPSIESNDNSAVSSKWVRDVIRDIVPPSVDMSNYVAKAGGTMTGTLTLVPNLPLSNDNTAATTKFVVDSVNDLSDTIVESFNGFSSTIANNFVNNERFDELKKRIDTIQGQITTLESSVNNQLADLTVLVDEQQLKITQLTDTIKGNETKFNEALQAQKTELTNTINQLVKRVEALETAPTTWYQSQVDQALQTLNN